MANTFFFFKAVALLTWLSTALLLGVAPAGAVHLPLPDVHLPEDVAKLQMIASSDMRQRRGGPDLRVPELNERRPEQQQEPAQPPPRQLKQDLQAFLARSVKALNFTKKISTLKEAEEKGQALNELAGVAKLASLARDILPYAAGLITAYATGGPPLAAIYLASETCSLSWGMLALFVDSAADILVARFQRLKEQKAEEYWQKHGLYPHPERLAHLTTCELYTAGNAVAGCCALAVGGTSPSMGLFELFLAAVTVEKLRNARRGEALMAQSAVGLNSDMQDIATDAKNDARSTLIAAAGIVVEKYPVVQETVQESALAKSALGAAADVWSGVVGSRGAVRPGGVLSVVGNKAKSLGTDEICGVAVAAWNLKEWVPQLREARASDLFEQTRESVEASAKWKVETEVAELVDQV